MLGVLLAAAPFWSAFVAVWLLPLLAAVLWMNGVRPFLRWPNLCLAGPLFGVVVLYLTAGAMDFPQGWLWQKEGYDWPRLMRRLPLFYLSEFCCCGAAGGGPPGGAPEPFFIAAVAALLLLPVYWYGQWNELLYRGSLPALLVLGLALRRGGGAGRGGARAPGRAPPPGPRSRGLVLVLGLGALTPAAHLVLSFQGLRLVPV